MVDLASCHVPSTICLCLLQPGAGQGGGGGELKSLGRCLLPELLPSHKPWLKIVSEEEQEHW